MSVFSNSVNLSEIFERYNCKPASFINMQIGFDGRLYILFNENIPERINDMFVPTISNSRYCVISLDVDWENEQIAGERFYDLGTQKMNYHFIQPVHDGLLLTASRCYCKNGDGELNAAVLDANGNIIRQYCFGDGINDVIVLSNGKIITSYFDEGIFGNYGWDAPIGANGLIVWNAEGDILWEADRDICDCYAMNIDDNERLWYYYYTDFELVCTDLRSEKVYQPHIEGSNMFILTSDGQSVIFDNGYNKHGSFVKEHLKGDTLLNPEKLRLDYNGNELSLRRYTSRSSLAAFIDNENNLYVKRFICV